MQFLSFNSETDVIVGGLLYASPNISDAVFSIPYFQDDLTWCIQKAGKSPWIINLLQCPTPTVCVVFIFGYGYVYSFLLYVLIQFDTKYKQRNNRDWHYAAILISLPSAIGLSQRFRPVSWNIRIFYGVILLANLLAVQVALVHWYKFLQIQTPMHQIASVEEIIANDYALMGSAAVKNAIDTDQKVKGAR